MNILIIGGSYFLGRILTMNLARKHQLTLVNRGTYSMKQYGVKEYHFDRHDEKSWKNLPYQDYDVVIDLCSYNKGDIQTVIDSLNGSIKHYIFISTVDVYKHQTGLHKDENHVLEDRHLGGEVGEYIIHKILLEYELEKSGVPYTILRPGNIYGPYNYAPRESLFIKRIVHHEPLLSIKEADAMFQLVYVEDVVKAIEKSIEKAAYNQIYNVISPEIYHYEDIYHALKPDYSLTSCLYDEAVSQNYPLPYPVFKQEQEIYNGQKICKELGLEYTTLEEGMKKTYDAFYSVYAKKEIYHEK